MTIETPRRRVLCVRPRANPATPPFMVALANEWIEALSLHADIVVVEEDFDFRDLCDQVRPDYVLYEGVHQDRPSPLRVSNPHAHPGVPRAAVLIGDGHDSTRPLLHESLEAYGIETIFGQSIIPQQHMPELAYRTCFSVPQFIDSRIFRDHGLEKVIPVSIFGAHASPSAYPWRAEVVWQLQQIMPTLCYTHPGYARDSLHPFVVHGERYARLLTQSHFSIADTTRYDYVVRKHIEIPACGAVLVAPDTPALAEYGFVDMENCLLGAGMELYARIDALARDPDLYARIRQNGHNLVQARYTRQAWRFIPDWFECRRLQGSGEVVRQVGQFGPFRLMPESAGHPAILDCTIRDNAITRILHEARAAILTGGNLDAADEALETAGSWVHHMLEPSLLQGVIALLRGDPDKAKLLLLRPSEKQIHRHRYHKIEEQFLLRMDPVESAWLLLTAQLLGDGDLTRLALGQAQVARHLSLRRILWLLGDATAAGAAGLHLDRRLPDDRLSIHWLGQEDFPTWCALMRRILLACDRPELASRLPRQEASSDQDPTRITEAA